MKVITLKKNFYKTVILTLLLFFGNFIYVFSQTSMSYDIISIKDGLSNNDVWGLEEDKYGYMWIATADGLNKYDGYSFTIYKNDPSDTTSLPSNHATSVIEDKKGDLWISTKNGLAKFDRRTEKFHVSRFSNSNREGANWISSLFEDSKGNLWLATTDGVKSFDRQTEKFTSYEVLREDNTIAVMAGPTYQLIETKSGDLFASTIAYGLVQFNYENNLFVQLKLKNDFQSKLRRNVVYVIYEDNNEDIWYGSRGGLYKIDPDELKAEEIFNSSLGTRLPDGTGIAQIDENTLWIGTWAEGLYKYNLKTKKTEMLPIKNRGLFAFYFDRTGILWITSFSGIMKFNFDKAPYELYTLEQEDNGQRVFIRSFSKSNYDPNKLWLGSNQGIYQFDRIEKKIIDNSSILNRINSIQKFNIEDLIEIGGKKLFIGSSQNGLFEYDIPNGKIKSYKPMKYSRSSLRFSEINVLLKDKRNRLWVGQDNGLSILNDDGTFTRIPNFEFKQYSMELISYLQKLRNTKTPLSQIIEVNDFADLSKEFVIAEDSYVLISGIGEGNRQWNMVDYGSLENAEGDTLWSMTKLESTFRASGALKNRQKIGIIKLSKGRYKLSYISDDSHSASSFNQMAPQDSLYWGIEIYSINEKEFSQYGSILEADIQRTQMNGSPIMSMFESSDGKIWAATTEGLSEIDPESFIIKNYTTETENDIRISNSIVEDVCEDNFGNIWIATQDGLNKIDRKNNSVSVYREKDGLPSSNCRALVLDDDGNLWVSGIKGISKVEISDNSKPPIFINYDVRDGLQGYTFIGNSAIKDRDGKLYFSGPDGLNAFYPGSTDKTRPKVVFTDLTVSNKKTADLFENLLDTKDLNELEEIQLSYDQNDISFEFSSIHFARPDKNRLQYMMEGIDEEWHDGTRRFASYANLDPGDYVFKVRGSNGDGFWTEQPRQIKVSISPAWWNNIYAYFAYGLIFFAFLYGVRKFEIERRARVDQFKQSKLRAEAAEAKAIAAEAERKMLEAENTRKTRELEEARSLQLSMLPKELPQLPNLDIAVYMKTATEVGGDYYDFHVGMDGVLTVVLGDATGHGMKAGTMVTTTKSLFNVLAPNPNIVETFHEMTRCLKLMHLEKLSMCMSMLKIANNKVQMSAAGMPPIFIYKQDERVIEEHVFKGMPLGTMSDFPYAVKESEVHSGDSILILSDGFPELLNDKKETFGYKRVRNLFEENSAKTPEEIITVLRKKGDEWTNQREPDDDVTFVVIKVK